jgi:hypothetical protein
VVDVKVSEEDLPDEKVTFGWENSDLSAEDKAKLVEIMKEETVENAPPVKEQASTTDEITADDLPPAEEAKTEPARKYKVKIDGVEREVDDQELIKGYQLETVARKRLEEAARIKAEAEAMREAMMYYQQPAAQTPAYSVQGQPGEPEFQTPTEKMLFDELQAVKGQVGAMSQARQMDVQKSVFNQIESELNGFKSAHPDLNEEGLTKIITIANEEGTRPSKRAFERIYKAEFLDVEKIKADTLAEYTKTLREKKAAALAPANQNGSAPKEPIDVNKMTDAERYAAMVKILEE